MIQFCVKEEAEDNTHRNPNTVMMICILYDMMSFNKSVSFAFSIFYQTHRPILPIHGNHFASHQTSHNMLTHQGVKVPLCPRFGPPNQGKRRRNWTWLQCFEAWHPAEVQSACAAKWCSRSKPNTHETYSKSLQFCSAWNSLKLFYRGYKY